MNYYKFDKFYDKNIKMKIHTDIENQTTRKEECYNTSEKHGLCLLGCWLIFMVTMSILISEYSKK